MSQPQIIIKTVPPGTMYEDLVTGELKPSATGHVWIELKDSNGNVRTFGFGPEKAGQPFGPGKVVDTDSKIYKGSVIEQVIDVNQGGHNAMLELLQKGYNSPPGSTVSVIGTDGKRHGFNLTYNGLTNSCVDFVWTVLGAGGLNPLSYEGRLLPIFNTLEIEKVRFANNAMSWLKESVDSIGSLFGFDQKIKSWYQQGQVDKQLYDSYCSWSTQKLMGDYFLYKPPSFDDWACPIGAFYESRSPGFDPATSIANKTFRITDANGRGMSAAQLAALDVNANGKLDGAELNNLYVWSDLNENGILDRSNTATNEFMTLAAGLANAGMTNLRAGDYEFYTRGNASARTVGQYHYTDPTGWVAELAVAEAPSNYTTLRSTDNMFLAHTPNGTEVINWGPSQIKISSNQLNMVGTDGNDSFDVNYYASYHGKYFNLNLIQNFYAGHGNDSMGGSNRSDNLWGGTGFDTLYGYDGDDRLYGEEGNDLIFGGNGNDTLVGGVGDDQLQGEYGHDVLSGGAGHDKLFGQVGNDWLLGGDGNDLMIGFTASNEAKQTLLPGETDHDVMFGGSGNDSMYGGLGNDYMDGGADNDLIVGDDGNDSLLGGSGDDELNGGTGDDTLIGGDGADKMFGGVGNDQLWGGNGNDIMLGFTPSNDPKQFLGVGETDHDVMYGGAGDDLMIGGFGNDQLWGGIGNDEIQGGDDHDLIYGESGNDRLFGGVGNDVIYGGDGDDIIIGFTGANETKQTLLPWESDDDFLYGGAGNDIILGGLGNDYIDGGAGADTMEGGQGNDTYIVNSVNDVILEHGNEGYDTVVSSSNYILNANIEELRLVEGFNINGTGNRLNNKIIGNSQDNILDGVTGADIMIGGLGNDTYYVDNVGDQAIELAGEGIDTVNSSISYTLGDNLENLTLLDFSKPEKGIADGVDILVYGYPKAYELDYMQGDAVPGYRGTCALTAIANLSTQANQALSEKEVVERAIENNWAVTDPNKTEYERGGSNYADQQALLNSFGINNGLLAGYSEESIANLIQGGRGVILAVNGGILWGDNAYLDNGSVNHVVTVTGVAREASTGNINGFYIADSGRGKVSDMTRYVSLADFRAAANVANAYAIYTIDPIKLWEEDINATGNALDNVLVGNRGKNILTGCRGNDTLIGQTGDDTYQFGSGDGQDTIVECDATADNTDVLQFTDINQNNLWFSHVGNDLKINVMGTADQIIIKDWYVPGQTGSDNQIERIKTADGFTLYNTDIEQFVQAMAAFAPPAAGQTYWTNGDTSNGRVLLTVTH